MKSIFDDAEFATLLARAESLGPESLRKWGKMDVAQMMAHVNRSLEISFGIIDVPSESNLLLRWLLKPLVFGSLPIKKNAPTSSTMRMTEPKDFDSEKQRLLANLRAANARGLNGQWHPHVAFGPLTASQWGRLHRKHLDHHLQQFSA